MATHKSAIKKHRRDEKLRMVNKMNRSKMKTRVKTFLKNLGNNQLAEAKAIFPDLISRIDKTIGKGTIHKNSGARYKSRLFLRARKAGLEV